MGRQGLPDFQGTLNGIRYYKRQLPWLVMSGHELGAPGWQAACGWCGSDGLQSEVALLNDGMSEIVGVQGNWAQGGSREVDGCEPSMVDGG